MKDARYMFRGELANEEVLVSLAMLVPGDGLRRAVARALWFDMADHLCGEVSLDALKKLADPERLDDMFDFTEDDFCQALQVVGYEDWQIEQRLRVHADHRRYLESRKTLPECERVLADNQKYCSHKEIPRIYSGKR